MMKTVILLIAMAVFSHTYSSAVQLSSVEKAFIDNEIVPVTVKIAPKKIVDVVYPSGVTVDLGKELTPTQVKDLPTLTWEADRSVYYTLLMVDPDVPSRTNFTLGEVRHWLVMNIPGCSVEHGDKVIEFIGSGPMKDTGLHRYIFLIYKQPNGIIQHNEPRSTKRMRANRLQTSASEFAQRYNLGEPEFGNFYQAQYDSYVDSLHAQFID